jgi:isoleucyl-tRNA synthetase
MFQPVDPQPNFATQEEEILAFWQREKMYEKSVEKNKNSSESFVVYDGPPTANAKPPLHTMVPMSFKDLVGRYQTMKGKRVARQAGWDTHGLPVEVQVEKALGLTSKKDILNLVLGDEAASIRAFNEACKNSVFEFKQEWDKFVPRVGYWTDTEHPYVTYEPEYISRTWGVFKEVWDKGLVYKGYKVLPYCPRCGTGLSAAEVAQEYQDVKDTSVYVAFPVEGVSNRAFLAWTTTPWTLPGNVGLAVGPDIDYVVVKQEAGEYILAKSRLEVLKGDYTILHEMKGSELVGLKYQPPYDSLKDVEGKKHEVVSADFVTTEDGTGIVHTAVMYGEDDFILGKKVGFAMEHTVGPDGSFLPRVTEFAGMNVRDALVPILKSLTEKGRLYAKQVITHSYPFCWRCKTALLYYAKDSWFIAMSSLRKELVENNNAVAWVPEHIQQGRFGDFVKEARDWAVSRERFWGTPLPIWTADTGDQICIGSLKELASLSKNPLPANFDPHRPFVDDIVLVKDGVEYRREPFVLDVWFDSGAMPYASGRFEQGLFPADYIAEAIDQTRGWFYTLMALGTAVKGVSPYKRVVCMGHLVDEQGKKMSKSGPNALNPAEILSICGADAMRWWILTVNSPGEPKSFSVKELQTSFRKNILLLWNVFNYFVTYANLSNFETPTQHNVHTGNLTILDRWMLSRQADVSEKVTTYLEAYDFMRAGRLLEEYVGDLSTWYLRRSRKRNDQAFFEVMYNVLLNLSTLLAPFIPFVSERMYQVLRHESMSESVHLLDWPGTIGVGDTALEERMALVKEAVELGLAVRASEKIKVRQPLATAFLQYNGELESELLDILADELNVLSVKTGNLEEGYPMKQGMRLSVALDIQMTDSLIQAGLARDLLRQIQQLRKQKGYAPGQMVILCVDPEQRFLVEPLLESTPEISKDAFLQEVVWGSATQEIQLNNQTVFIDLAE